MKNDFNWLDRLIRFLRINKIKKFLKNSKKICDLGCGDGKILHYLYRKFKLEYALGIDYKIENFKKNNLLFLRGDISKIPVNDQFFDTTLLLAVIEHLDINELSPILTEIKRVLAEKGKLIITTPSSRSKPILEFLAFRLGIISKKEIEDHKHYYALKEICDLLEKSGFGIEYSKTFQFGLNLLVVAKKLL